MIEPGAKPSRAEPDASPPPPLPARRAVWAAAFFSAGLIAAHLGAAWPSLWSFGGGAAVALLALFTRGVAARAALALAALAFGAGVYQFRIAELPADSLAHRLSPQPSIVTLEGRIDSTPRIAPALRGRFAPFARPDALDPVTRFEFRAERLIERNSSGVPVTCEISGRLWARADAALPHLRAGDTVAITGTAALINQPTNPGEPDTPLLARQRGIVARISISNAELIAPIPREQGWRAALIPAWMRALASLRARAGAWMDAPRASAPPPSAAGDPEREARAILRAMLLGERSPDLNEIGDAFTRLGIAHILAISGMNLVVLAGAATLLLRLVGERPILQPMLVAASVLLYLLLIPAESPILRAAIMVLSFMLAEACGRRYDRITILAWTMLATLLWRPLDLFAPGFQLSYAIVAGLILFSNTTRERLFGVRPERDTRGVARWLIEKTKDAAAASLVAWAVASPIAAYHMGTFSPFGVLTTLLIAPLATAMMAGGYLTLVVGIISPAAADLIAPAMIATSSFAARFVHLMDGAPGTVVYLPRLPLWVVLAVLAAVVWWLAAPDPRAVERAKESAEEWTAMRRRLRRRVASRLALTAIALGSLAYTLLHRALPPTVALRIDVFDVGDGSCWLIRSGADAVLFDAGSSRPEMGEFELPRAIRAVGAWPVRRAIISHPNLDHYNALPDLAERVGVRRVMVNPLFHRALAVPRPGPGSPAANPAIGLLAHELARRAVSPAPLAAGDELALGGASIRVLSPRADDDFRRDNDTSLVLLVTIPTAAGERRVLLCGDIQDEAIAALVERHPDLRADIMEAPHHGSARPAAIEFVERTAPAHVVQSTGPSRLNDERWAALRATRDWLSTAAVGAVTIEIAPGGEITTRGTLTRRAAPAID